METIILIKEYKQTMEQIHYQKIQRNKGTHSSVWKNKFNQRIKNTGTNTLPTLPFEEMKQTIRQNKKKINKTVIKNNFNQRIQINNGTNTLANT